MTTMEVELHPLLSTNDVVAATGATYRQVDYWVRTGLVPGQSPEGPGSGHRRRWHPAQVNRVRLILLASRLSNRPLADVVALIEAEMTVQHMDGQTLAVAS